MENKGAEHGRRKIQMNFTSSMEQKMQKMKMVGGIHGQNVSL